LHGDRALRVVLSLTRLPLPSLFLRWFLFFSLPQILSVYMSGSKNMSYDSASLTTPDIKW